ncbi:MULTISPECIES: hypothetical protein [Alphaproteobacteria]|nr:MULTISPECIES: hypothetical protein [Alphaproteobacteria]
MSRLSTAPIGTGHRVDDIAVVSAPRKICATIDSGVANVLLTRSTGF